MVPATFRLSFSKFYSRSLQNLILFSAKFSLSLSEKWDGLKLPPLTAAPIETWMMKDPDMTCMRTEMLALAEQYSETEQTLGKWQRFEPF